jgi:hypothetical protein
MAAELCGDGAGKTNAEWPILIRRQCYYGSAVGEEKKRERGVKKPTPGVLLPLAGGEGDENDYVRYIAANTRQAGWLKWSCLVS